MRSIAKQSVTEAEAIEFLEGLEQHNMYRDAVQVSYDINENGFLVRKTSVFHNIVEANNFARKINSITKPIIEGV